MHFYNPFPTKASAAFAALPARHVILIFVVSVVVGYLLASSIWPEALTPDAAPLEDAAAWSLLYGLLALLLWLAGIRKGVPRLASFGAWPGRRQALIYALLAVPLIGVSEFFVYLVFLPLTYVDPEFVTEWVLDQSTLIWPRSEPGGLAASVVNVALTVVIAPIVEETIFRGFLLNRWWWYYGMWRGAVFSSVLFALLHMDFAGAFVFGMVLSLIYVKTKSLIGPIIVHVSNNGLLVLLLLAEALFLGGIEPQTLEQFRAYWWLGLLGGAIGVPWLLWFAKRLLRPGPV
ncbi:MAG: CPBP family intramembrane glutamic endopeptidase [Alphaproteobacteria bacterium]|nr:CPBP family intramembrane glutamic endopeptidase [Alphaproteobacteria bacterium]